MPGSETTPKDEGNKQILLKFLRYKPEASLTDISSKLGVDNKTARSYLTELVTKDLVHYYRPSTQKKQEYYSLKV